MSSGGEAKRRGPGDGRAAGLRAARGEERRDEDAHRAERAEGRLDGAERAAVRLVDVELLELEQPRVEAVEPEAREHDEAWRLKGPGRPRRWRKLRPASEGAARLAAWQIAILNPYAGYPPTPPGGTARLAAAVAALRGAWASPEPSDDPRRLIRPGPQTGRAARFDELRSRGRASSRGAAPRREGWRGRRARRRRRRARALRG